MLVNYLPGEITTATPNLVVHVVLPNGDIKDVRIAMNISSPLLRVNLIFDPKTKRPIGIRDVFIADDAPVDGCKLLKELFDAEGIVGGYETFCEYRRTARELRKPGLPPDDYLPQAVLDMRSGKFKKQLPPPPTRRPKDSKPEAVARR